MAQKVLILGESGTGKSHSIQYLDPKTTFVICPDRKELPFKGSKKLYFTVIGEDKQIKYSKSNYVEINSMKEIRAKVKLIAEHRPDITDVIIDTVTYAMIESVMKEAKTKGYDKFTEFADELYQMINDIPNYRKDLFVWFMAHIEVESADGVKTYSFKVPAGKLTREKIVPEGLFTVVLYTDCVMIENKPTYSFLTQNTGNNTGKTPEGMFPDIRIENNLKYVKECIQAYYNDEAPPEAKVVKVNSETQF